MATGRPRLTGEDVLARLGERGLDFIGGLEPYDRKQIEDFLDEVLAESDIDEERREAAEEAADKMATELKLRFKRWAEDTVEDATIGNLVERLDENFRDLIDDVRGDIS